MTVSSRPSTCIAAAAIAAAERTGPGIVPAAGIDPDLAPEFQATGPEYQATGPANQAIGPATPAIVPAIQAIVPATRAIVRATRDIGPVIVRDIAAASFGSVVLLRIAGRPAAPLQPARRSAS